MWLEVYPGLMSGLSGCEAFLTHPAARAIGRHFKKGNMCYKRNRRTAPREITPESNGGTSAPLVLEHRSQAAQGRNDVVEFPSNFMLREPPNHPVSETIASCFLQSGLSELRKEMGTTLHFMIRPYNEFFNVLSLSLLIFFLSFSPSLLSSSSLLCLTLSVSLFRLWCTYNSTRMFLLLSLLNASF